ncbi:T9SS type A sorting domain-containing protein [Riemerella anatipestifer]|uniref:DUF676 domain-containing protein n=1 Tax=Riemerella anatipestifer RA-CH-1 TaxID=1228997 RepID=J9R5S8_RIEAN|nr:T9SS type A sorting domain-containing protein [Riemerella anatipestifer]AFR35823.1 hypothetical protein B739_1225 [Riemerella anatipestifer RA-CH-1]AIH02874.1 hypothetical protein M949_1707 [Riemerella anatipestifer CH3]MCO7331023.1 T9SS type A sorting domain-containing protein [Riemerella anatipestifer]MCO7349927.1 T9SS type A sorting domain-containing protein [Riemerella anatipestifer]MCU7581666.1 T9SS type A sorting domain-containing protein [Riemerella anatipestifer]
MKHILTLSFTCIFTITSFAQLPSVQEYNTQKQTFWQQALAPLQQNSQQSSRLAENNTILYDKATPFAGLFTFNEPDNNYSYSEHFQQSLSELHTASDNTLFESPESLLKRVNSLPNSSIVPVGILNATFSYLNYTPENPRLNALNFQNNQFTTIDARPAFSQKQVSIVSPLRRAVPLLGNQLTYRFSSDMWYQHGAKAIKSLTVDFGNGTAHQVIQNGAFVRTDFPITYTTGSTNKLLTCSIVYTDNSSITTYSVIQMLPITQNTSNTGLFSHISTIPDPSSGAKGQLEYRIFYGNTNNNQKLKKPFIIVDGFDPGDKRRITADDCKNDEKCLELNPDFNPNKYQSIESLMKYNDQKSDLKAQLTALGYDVVIVNFPNYKNNLGQEIDGGADDIFRNGRTVASFIQKLNADLQANGSTEKLVVVGPSMGGQITRYALAYLEKNNIPTNTRLWISMDSPHQGATIPLAIQGNLYWMGELLGKEDARKQYRSILQSKAAKQMLLETFKEEPIYMPTLGFRNFIRVVGDDHIQYKQELKNNGISGSNGYPMLNGIKKIAITNGSISGAKNVSPGSKFYEVAAFAKVRFFGVKVDNKPVFRINNWFSQNQNIPGKIFENFSYKPYNAYSLDYTHSNFYNSLESVPGGNFNSANDLKNEVYKTLVGTDASSSFLGALILTEPHLKVEQRLPNNIATPIPPQSFIPTHSALDTSGFSDWYQPIDKNLVCTGQTPFDSYYGEANNLPHVSFTNNMVQWLLGWLNGNELPPTFSTSNLTLNGNSVICENTEEFYSFSNICEVPTGTNFSTSPSLSVVNVSSSGITVKGVKNGLGFIYINLPNKQTIAKKIWVGKPQLRIKPEEGSTNYVVQSIESLDTGATLEDQGLTPADVTWRRKDTGAIRTGYTYFANGRGYNWHLDLEVNAKNKCGSTTYATTITPPPPGMCEYTYTVSKVQNDDYTIARIMEPVCPKQSPEDNNLIQSQSTSSETYHITVVNSLGNTVIQKTGKDFSLSNLPTGSYFVKIIKDGQMLVGQTLIKK